MADPFAPAIASVMEGWGYTCVVSVLPKFRDYDGDQPTLYICTIGKASISWLAFQSVSAKQAYDLVYVYPNELSDTVGNDIWQFKNLVLEEFQGVNSTMSEAAPPAWNVVCQDVSDYDRPLFKQGYTYSHIRVFVDYLQN